ncbi:MAG: hypothetical protein CMI19_08640 [Opitutae bacterium]|nr:hypothetical protein [Opitutae bacterium]
MASQVGFNPTGGRRESQSKPISLELIIVIHIKDYIQVPSPQNSPSRPDSSPKDCNVVSFPDPNCVSKEYIGRFVDKLMEMPDNPKIDFKSHNFDELTDPIDVVARRILSEEKW